MTPIASATVMPPGYDFVRPLGSGGMGEVVLARRGADGELVAIKFVAPARANDAAGRRFDREARLMTGFDHPNVVRVFDRGHAAGRDYLVMEYVDGPSLRDRLTPLRPLPADVVRPLLRDIAGALTYLESQGVIHRDLKPENVLLAPQAGPKVTDFGVAAATDDAALTATGEVLGTYDYMAPEQRARLPVDARADQYALAVIAYEMLTGRRPVGAFKRPSQLNPALAPAVDAVLARALQEDADERFARAADFSAELDRALAARQRRRPWALVAAGAATGLALAAWFTVSRPREAVNHAAHGAAPKPSEEPVAQPAVPDPSPYLKRALDLKKRGQFDKALAELDAALALDPGHVEALVGRASVLVNLGRAADAQADCNAALRRDPRSAAAHAWRGWAATKLPTPDADAALADLDAALRLDPNLGTAYQFRAMVWQGRRETAKSRDDLVEAVRCEPDNFYAHGTLAQLYASNARPELRDPAKAVAHGRRACELTDWSDWRQLRAYAMALAAANDYPAAVTQVEKALALAPESSQGGLRTQLANYRRRLPAAPKGGRP